MPGRSAAGSRRLFHPPTSAGMGRKFRFLPTDTPAPQQLPTASTFPSYLADGQTGDTKRKKKTAAPPGPILQPGAGRKPRREPPFPPPSHPDAVAPAGPGSKGPEVAEGEEVRVEEAEKPGGAAESAREKKISNKTTLTRPLPGCNILWK